MRAEPISLLYEKGRVLHRRGLDQLEVEMMAFSREWDRAVDGSPNRLDAAVWGLTRLSNDHADPDRISSTQPLRSRPAIGAANAIFRSLHDAWADTTAPHGWLILTVPGGLSPRSSAI